MQSPVCQDLQRRRLVAVIHEEVLGRSQIRSHPYVHIENQEPGHLALQPAASVQLTLLKLEHSAPPFRETDAQIYIHSGVQGPGSSVLWRGKSQTRHGESHYTKLRRISNC